jgi:hypothetical protein
MSAIPIVKGLGSAAKAVSITDANATHPATKGVYIGTGESYDFSFDGSTFVTFSNCPEGAVLPLRVVGVRKTSGGAAPSSGDIAFLY